MKLYAQLWNVIIAIAMHSSINSKIGSGQRGNYPTLKEAKYVWVFFSVLTPSEFRPETVTISISISVG